MLSIVILFCDKDFQYIPDLISNIKECVKIPYQFVFIDNRENNKDEFQPEVDWKYFSFGYNARQVQGRKKGVELADGEYIWFVDADDKVLEVTAEMEQLCHKNYDMIVFKESHPVVIEGQLLLRDNFYKIGVQLWDKWVKTDALRKAEELIPTDLSGIASEDTMLVMGSLKFSKTVYFHPKKIYDYQRHRSNCGAFKFNSLEHYKSIIYGYTEVTDCIDKMLTDEEKVMNLWNEQRHSDVRFFIEKLMYCDPKIIPDCVKLITEAFSFEDILVYWKGFYENEKWIGPGFVAAKKAFIKEFPEHEVDIEARNVYKYYTLNEAGEEYCYKTEVNYIEPECLKNWSHTLSIICLVYEGNMKYLSSFLKMTRNVKVKHEVVVVDNRDDKTKPLKCNLENVVVVETEKNLGILDGRRFGFEHSTGDYIWYVDIDDEIMDVYDRDFGDSEIIKFPFYMNDNFINDVYSCVIRDKDVATGNTVCQVDVMLWDKWFKRNVLEKVYNRIPHFFCIYGEDSLVSLTALDYANDVRCIDCWPMYRYRTNSDSITLRDIKTKKEVDRLFIGFDEVVKLYSYLKVKVSPKEDPNLIYYLGIANHADPKIKPYFIKTIKEKLGEKETKKIILEKYSELEKYINS